MLSKDLENELFDLSHLPDINIVDLVCDIIDDNGWLVEEVERLDGLIKASISKNDYKGLFIINRIRHRYEVEIFHDDGTIFIHFEDFGKIIDCLKLF